MKYEFEYDEIDCCYACPLFYDYIYCELEQLHDLAGHTRDEYTDYDDNKRPEWCKLKEVDNGKFPR